MKATNSLKNIKTKPIKEQNDIENIPRDQKPKLILIDELHQYADSWNYNSLNKVFSQFALQSRKVSSNIYWSSQNFNQVSNRIRQITKIIYMPQITAYDTNGKPILLEVKTAKEDIYGNYNVNNKFCLPLINYKKQYICDLYDTYEFIDEMEDPTETIKNQMVAKYGGFDGNKMHLKSILILDEGINPSLAGHIVNYIIN